MFFSPGPLSGEDGDGEDKKSARTCSAGSFFAGRHVFSNSPIFEGSILYIEEWGFLYVMFQNHRERCPRSSMSWTDTGSVEVSTT